MDFGLVLIHCDNQRAIHLLKHSIALWRYMHRRDPSCSGLRKSGWRGSRSNLRSVLQDRGDKTDIFTKAVAPENSAKCRKEMGGLCI